MKCSDIALKIFIAKEFGHIKSNAHFWKQYSKRGSIDALKYNNSEHDFITNTYLQKYTDNEGIICSFDDEFPIINPNVNDSDKPYLLFYKGDISLLQDLNNNVAVIGLVNPTSEIINREIEIVEQLTNKNITIVSGLANGCDAIAHKYCVDFNKRTIAILPTDFHNIYPAVNRNLAENIVSSNGLLLTEYCKKSSGRHDAINRLIERDRLQAMFSKAIILIASYRKNEGDSGSRHAIEAARKYEIARFVMFDEMKDSDNIQFGLNKDLVDAEYSDVKVLHKNSIEAISMLHNPHLIKKPFYEEMTQLEFDWNLSLPIHA